VRKLEILEAEVLKRLKDTHLKQQEAILEIQKIISKKELSSDLLMHQDSILQQNSSVSF
jgi:hypothetical protein